MSFDTAKHSETLGPVLSSPRMRARHPLNDHRYETTHCMDDGGKKQKRICLHSDGVVYMLKFFMAGIIFPEAGVCLAAIA